MRGGRGGAVWLWNFHSINPLNNSNPQSKKRVNKITKRCSFTWAFASKNSLTGRRTSRGYGTGLDRFVNGCTEIFWQHPGWINSRGGRKQESVKVSETTKTLWSCTRLRIFWTDYNWFWRTEPVRLEPLFPSLLNTAELFLKRAPLLIWHSWLSDPV